MTEISLPNPKDIVVRFRYWFFFIVTWCGLKNHANAQVYHAVYDLRCEYQTHPMNVDQLSPTFTYKIRNLDLEVFIESLTLRIGKDSLMSTIVWEQDESNNASYIQYEGQRLERDTDYYFEIDVTDRDGNVFLSEKPGKFHTGINGDFGEAEWLTNPSSFPDLASYYRTEFSHSDSIVQVVLFIASGGPHEIHIDGKRRYDQLLNPVFMDYEEYIPYNAYDITQSIDFSNENHVIGIVLGNGWYNFNTKTSWNFDKADWRDIPKVKFVLSLRDVNNDVTYIHSSVENTQTSLGPLRYNSIYMGEFYVHESTFSDWSQVGFNNREWIPPTRAYDHIELKAQYLEPTVIRDTLTAQKILSVSDRNYIITLPSNNAAIASWKLFGKSGQSFRVLYGEQTNGDGTSVIVSNLTSHILPGDNAAVGFQEDRITLLQEDTVYFTNSFNYKGFQYIQISSDLPFAIDNQSVKVYPVNTEINATGNLAFNEPLLDSILAISQRSYLSNLHGFPTDCPTREKNGWTGDGHFLIQSAFYGFNGYNLYRKWMEDHRNAQTDEGMMPNIIPTADWGFDPRLDWSVSTILVPWYAYLFTGNDQIIRENIDAMDDFMSFWKSYSYHNMVFAGLGDWNSSGSKSSITLISSVYYYHAAEVMSYMHHQLGRNTRSDYYRKLAVKIRNSINANLLDSGTGIYENGTQTEQAMALYYGVAPEEMKGQVLDQLISAIEANNFQLDMGMIGAKVILPALAMNGKDSLAYTLVTGRNHPSWGGLVSLGATTLTEDWTYKGLGTYYGGSQNHAAMGSVIEYLYGELAGVKPVYQFDDYLHLEISPFFPEGEMTSSVKTELGLGQYYQTWTKTSDGSVHLEIETPVNSKMRFKIPDSFVLSEIVQNGQNIPFAKNAEMDFLDFSNGLFEIHLVRDSTETDYPINNKARGEILMQKSGFVFHHEEGSYPDKGEFRIVSMDGKQLYKRDIDYQGFLDTILIDWDAIERHELIDRVLFVQLINLNGEMLQYYYGSWRIR
jgi:alpha-L-rhamnosidase